MTGDLLLKMVAGAKLPAGKLAMHRFAMDQMMEAYEVFGAAAANRALKDVLTA